ncbi:MAG TPA: hypothetical protein ENI32_08195, partial [Candidatus Syntrophoarchaeum butanivorans]|nr:hypothetical protein [Candidatus Syntrophoarchaeum butanivorans]
MGVQIYKNGLDLAILIFARIIASVSVLNLLIATTRIQDALAALRWF